MKIKKHKKGFDQPKSPSNAQAAPLPTTEALAHSSIEERFKKRHDNGQRHKW